MYKQRFERKHINPFGRRRRRVFFQFCILYYYNMHLRDAGRTRTVETLIQTDYSLSQFHILAYLLVIILHNIMGVGITRTRGTNCFQRTAVAYCCIIYIQILYII